MKKLGTLVLTLMMGFSLLTGCGSDPVADELEKFVNTDMKEVNANYKEMTDEVANWASYEDDAAFVTSLEDVLIPNVEESLDILSKAEVTTDEVKSLKDKYTKSLDKYKEGFELMLSAANNGDADLLTEGMAVTEEALALLDEYNAAMEALAEEKGMKVTY